jgi:hypothetical protein
MTRKRFVTVPPGATQLTGTLQGRSCTARQRVYSYADQCAWPLESLIIELLAA